jgi:hypothetical protein
MPDKPGFYLNRSTDADGVEPDARHYECDCCVFGPEEVLPMIA